MKQNFCTAKRKKPNAPENTRPRVEQSLAAAALSDKLYLAPITETAEWCVNSGFPVYFYIFGGGDAKKEVRRTKADQQIREY